MPATDGIQRCLTDLQTALPHRYSQWLVEEPESHNYRVVASVIPEGESGYAEAHRTGIIGQVFRTEEAILADQVREHPLYDPFDNEIDWELCFPLFDDGEMAAVINLEGTGVLGMTAELWDRVCEAVQGITRCRPPSVAPQADSPRLLATRRIVIHAGSEGDQSSDIAAVARAIARGGETTLLVGNYPDLLSGRGPTMTEAMQQGLGVSYCFFGVERRLDILATGSMTHRDILENRMDWWNIARGRYAFVLGCVSN